MKCSTTVRPGESLQAAIERAQEGAVICLLPGRWAENLEITKSLTLRGAGAKNSSITAKNRDHPVVWITATKRAITVALEGLTIAGARGECADWHRGICANGLLIQGPARVQLSDTIISENRRSGLFLWGASYADISSSVISANGHYGIWLMDSARAKISGSVISGNGFGPADGLDSDRDGIALRGSARAEIVSSVIFKNGHHGLWVSDSAQVEIGNSTISGNGRGGIWLRDGARARIWQNRIIDNGGYGVALFQWPCFVTTCAFRGRVQGGANIISKSRKANGNGKHEPAVCPEKLRFLASEGSGEYP